MSEYEVYRAFDDGLTREELAGAVEKCGEAIENLRTEGEDVSYLGSEVLLDDEETIVGTMCCFDASSREIVEELNERAGVPFTRTYRRGTPVEGERSKTA